MTRLIIERCVAAINYEPVIIECIGEWLAVSKYPSLMYFVRAMPNLYKVEQRKAQVGKKYKRSIGADRKVMEM